MKHSYLKPKTAGNSKKNSNISSIIYKDIGDAIHKNYQQRISKKNTHKQRDSITIIYDPIKSRSKDKQSVITKEDIQGSRNSKNSINGTIYSRKMSGADKLKK